MNGSLKSRWIRADDTSHTLRMLWTTSMPSMPLQCANVSQGSLVSGSEIGLQVAKYKDNSRRVVEFPCRPGALRK